ncbi:MAG: nitroreductase family protein [Flavobacteriaceae bacterium]
MKEKTVSEAIAHRRSVRVFDADKPLKAEDVKASIAEAVLAPNSSNLQLWEFYHVYSPEVKQKLAATCFNQPAAKTAQHLVVAVVRLDLWPQRTQANAHFIEKRLSDEDKSDPKKVRAALNYYTNILPKLYSGRALFRGLLAKLKMALRGLSKVTYREVGATDLRVVGHKSCALAAQTFMLSMAAKGLDTCPMEGFDSKRAKEILNLPAAAQISMILGCGIRKKEGVYGERFRIPFDAVYKEV